MKRAGDLVDIFTVDFEDWYQGIEIERGDLLTQIGQRHRDVNRRGRFAGPALFVGEDDPMGAGPMGAMLGQEGALLSVFVRRVLSRPDQCG